MFRNSIGDINTPDYSYWTNFLNQTSEKNFLQDLPSSNLVYGMVGYSWLLWFWNEFFMLIILLNFLIAIISQSYDAVMTKEMIFLYEARCDYNCETNILLDWFLGLAGQVKRAKVFSLSTPVQGEDMAMNEYTGFVRPLKMYVNQEMVSLKKKMNRDYTDIKTDVAGIEEKVTKFLKLAGKGGSSLSSRR